MRQVKIENNIMLWRLFRKRKGAIILLILVKNMRQSRNINIIVDAGGNRLVLINDILFKGKSRRNQKRKT